MNSTTLALILRILGPNDNMTHITGLTANIQDSFFQISSSAIVKSSNETSNTNVSLTTNPPNNTSIWLIYDRFPENRTLYHDPILGLGPLNLRPPHVIGTGVYVGLIVSAVVIFVVVLAGSLYLHIFGKRSSYESLGQQQFVKEQ